MAITANKLLGKKEKGGALTVRPTTSLTSYKNIESPDTKKSESGDLGKTLFTIQKKQGNIIRINDLYKNYDLKKRKKLKPIGFLVGQNNLYLTNSDGALIVVDLISGNILKVEKISRDLVSKPYIYNGELFIVKNGSIIKYD